METEHPEPRFLLNTPLPLLLPPSNLEASFSSNSGYLWKSCAAQVAGFTVFDQSFGAALVIGKLSQDKALRSKRETEGELGGSGAGVWRGEVVPPRGNRAPGPHLPLWWPLQVLVNYQGHGLKSCYMLPSCGQYIFFSSH